MTLWETASTLSGNQEGFSLTQRGTQYYGQMRKDPELAF